MAGCGRQWRGSRRVDGGLRGVRRVAGCGSWACWAGLGLVRNLGPGHAAKRGAEHGIDDAVARWARENPRSQALNARARRLLPGGVTHDIRLTEPFPVAVARAEG